MACFIFMMFPIALINVIAAIILVKNVTETSRPKLDVLGVILSTIGFGGLLYAFATGGTKGWTSTEVLAMFIVGGISILFFIFRQLKLISRFLNSVFSVTVCSH